jgi:hypothetical protein
MKTRKPTLAETLLFRSSEAIARTPARPLAFVLLTKLKSRRTAIQGIDLERARIKAHSGATLEALEMVKEELRLFPDSGVGRCFLEELQARLPTKEPSSTALQDAEFLSLYEKVRPYTMLSAERLFSLFNGSKAVCVEEAPGNFVECGVAGGGSSALLAWTIKRFSRHQRKIYAFDTFEGMPDPGPEDMRRGVQANATGWGSGTCAAPVSCLRKICEVLDVWDLVVPVQGLFQNTLPSMRAEIGDVSLLHLDGDWYDSTRSVLENLYDQVSSGGFVQIDDYGFWEGCRKAVDEFEKERSLSFAKRPVDSSGICFRKPV